MHCTKISAEFEFGGHSLLGAHPQKCAVGLQRQENQSRLSSFILNNYIISRLYEWRISTACLFASDNLMQCVHDRSHQIIQNWTNTIDGCGTIIGYLESTDNFWPTQTLLTLQTFCSWEIRDLAYLVCWCRGCICALGTWCTCWYFLFTQSVQIYTAPLSRKRIRSASCQ